MKQLRSYIFYIVGAFVIGKCLMIVDYPAISSADLAAVALGLFLVWYFSYIKEMKETYDLIALPIVLRLQVFLFLLNILLKAFIHTKTLDNLGECKSK